MRDAIPWNILLIQGLLRRLNVLCMVNIPSITGRLSASAGFIRTQGLRHCGDASKINQRLHSIEPDQDQVSYRFNIMVNDALI
jgi:hypothetical protein